MGTHYCHLKLDERRKLAKWLEAKMPISEIADRLGRDPSTIYRDIKRNRYTVECPHWSGPPFGMELSRFQEGDEMASKREKPEDIVLKLRQVEVLQGQGKSVQEAVRQIGVTVQTYYRWRKEYGGMSRDQLKRLKELETENTRLRRAVSDLTLDKMILAEVARETSKPFPPQAVHRPCAANPQRIRAQGLPHIRSAPLYAAQGALWSTGRSPADRGHHRVGRRVWPLWISHDHWAAEQQRLACKSQAR
mgnify:FL=1|tara:strand:- start:54 stop:797 length:744 start_codon:yes stop_codon:yes gene_type:complete